MADYGSGIYLDENFDFEVDQTGDLRSDDDVSELHKDLAFNVVRALKYGEGISTPENIANNGAVGEPLTGGMLTDIELAVGKVIGDDDRIDAVIAVEADKADGQDNYVTIETDVRIDVETESFEFIIPAS